MNSKQQADDLILGIENILSKNRHSLLETEKETLNNAIQFLASKKENISKLDYGKLLMLALELVARFFIKDFDQFKNLF